MCSGNVLKNGLTDLMLKSFLIITETSDKIRLVFRRVIAKISSIKAIESRHFSV